LYKSEQELFEGSIIKDSTIVESDGCLVSRDITFKDSTEVNNAVSDEESEEFSSFIRIN
jgi:hypothetical protein